MEWKAEEGLLAELIIRRSSGKFTTQVSERSLSHASIFH